VNQQPIEVEGKRTLTQNAALHVFFSLLADELNNAGLDMKRTLKESVEIPWTEKTVKDYLWRPIQEAVTSKHSTTELDRKEDIDKTYDVLMRHLGDKFGISVQFPDKDNG